MMLGAWKQSLLHTSARSSVLGSDSRSADAQQVFTLLTWQAAYRALHRRSLGRRWPDPAGDDAASTAPHHCKHGETRRKAAEKLKPTGH